jgi:hypothetical protein
MDTPAPAVEHMGVDHSRADVAVAEELLNGADVVTVLEEVGGKAVAEGVAARVLVDAGVADGLFDGALEGGFSGMVPADPAGARVNGAVGGGKDILPCPLAAGVWILAFEREG